VSAIRPVFDSETWWTVEGSETWSKRAALAAASAAHVIVLVFSMSSVPVRPGIAEGTPDGINVETIDAETYERLTSSTAGRHAHEASAQPTAVQQPLPQKPDEIESHQQDEPSQHDKAIPASATPAARPPEAHDNDFADLIEKFAKPTLEHDLRKHAVTQSQRASPRTATLDPNAGHTLEAQIKATLAHRGAVSEFARHVARTVNRAKPAFADSRGIVIVEFIVLPDGEISDLKLVVSSRNSALDSDVVAALQGIRFKPPPPGTPLAERSFSITFTYR